MKKYLFGAGYRPRFLFSFRTILAALAILLSMSSMIVIGTLFYRTTSDYLIEHQMQLDQRIFNQSLSRFNDGLVRLQTGSLLAVNDNPTYSSPLSFIFPKTQVIIRNGILENLRVSLHKTKLILKDAKDICYFTDSQTIISSSEYPAMEKLSQKDFLAHFGWNREQTAVYFPGDPLYTPTTEETKQYESQILVIQPDFVSDTETNTYCLAVSTDFLTEYVDSKLAIGIVSGQGNVIINHTPFSDGELLQIRDRDSDDGTCYHAFLDAFRLHFFYFPDSLSLESQTSTLIDYYLICGIVLTVISVLTASFFARPLVRPLREMERRLSQYDAGTAQTAVFSSPDDLPKNSIFIYLSVIVLSTSLLFSLISYSFLRNSTKETLMSHLETSFQQASSDTARCLDNLRYVSLFMAYDNQIQKFLEDPDTNTSEDTDSINNFLKNIQLIYTIPIDLQLYDINRNMIASTSYLTPEIFGLISLKESRVEWKVINYRNRNMVLLHMSIIDLDSYRTKGSLALFSDELYVRQSYDYFPVSYNVYIYDRSGTVLSSTDRTLIGQTLPACSGTESELSEQIKNTELMLTVRYGSHIAEKELNNTAGGIAFFLVMIFAAIVLLNILISRYLLRQIRQFGETMLQVSSRNLNVKQIPSGIVTEIYHTYEAFNKMTERIQSLLNEVVISEKHRNDLEIEKRQSELQFLQSQINPHFLYNTFETINNIIISGDSGLAINTLNTLSDMLRFTTRSGSLFIPVSEELKYAQLYTKIISVQNADLIHISFSFSPEILTLPTMKFLLQPILENAIIHGLKPKGGSGNIYVTGMAANGKLIFTVRDDGVGVSSDKIKELNDILHSGGNRKSTGLPNVAGRLDLLYGEAASVTLISPRNEGCIITVIQPIRSSVGDLSPEAGSFGQAGAAGLPEE